MENLPHQLLRWFRFGWAVGVAWDEATRVHFARTTPLARLGSPDDVVHAVRYLLEGGDYVTGTTLVVDGGRLIR